MSLWFRSAPLQLIFFAMVSFLVFTVRVPFHEAPSSPSQGVGGVASARIRDIDKICQQFPTIERCSNIGCQSNWKDDSVG